MLTLRPSHFPTQQQQVADCFSFLHSASFLQSCSLPPVDWLGSRSWFLDYFYVTNFCSSICDCLSMADTMVASPMKSDLHCTRKNKKPLMEKRRRARINSCLTQLKSLVLQAIKKDSSQFSKLEKADILELTVKHLRALQRQQGCMGMGGGAGGSPDVLTKYRAGFNECAKEVVRYMGSVREVNEQVKEKVVCHLAGVLQHVNSPVAAHMEASASMHHPHHMNPHHLKPLHVQIPPHPPQQQQMGNPNVASAIAPSVIMHTAAVSHSPPLVVPLGGGAYSHQTTPLRPSSSASSSSTSSSSSQECHHNSSSPVSASQTPMTSLPMSTVSAGSVAMSQPPMSSAIPAAYRLMPSGSGTVAVYVGNAAADAPNMPRGTAHSDTLSMEAVPLYSVSLPTQHSHSHAPSMAAFVTPPPTPLYEAVSPVKSERSPLTSSACLPVDLRQMSKVKSMYDCPAMSASGPVAALADDKLWRPW